MRAKNITVSLDEDVIRRAKVTAARRGLSLSALLREQLERLAEADERYESARRAALQWMQQGAALGTAARPGRDELHARDAVC